MRDRTRELHQVSDSDNDSEEGGEGRLRPPATPPWPRRGGCGRRCGLWGCARRSWSGCRRGSWERPLPPHELRQDLQRLRDEIQELTREIRGGLKGLEPPKEDEENPNSVGARMRRTQHGVLAQQFLGVTGRLQAAQARHRQRSLERIRRQLHIAGSPPLSEEELERILESGRSEVFVANVLGASRAALDELGERHRELQRLERGLRELGELFGLLGGAVEAQGELIERIELQVRNSGAHLEKGRGHLGRARRHQQGARKKRLAFAACVSVAILVLVAIVAASVAAG